MKLEFNAQRTILVVDFDKKTYSWGEGYGNNALLMPTIKEMRELEKRLIREGFEEVA